MNAPFDITGVRLETERLILREWQLSDVDDLFEYASVPGVGECAGWPHHKDKDESIYRVNHFIELKETFAIVYKENNKVIGSIGIDLYGSEDKLTEFDGYKGREIGYVLSKDYWGLGLMTEGVKAVIDYLFNVLDYDFLLCGHYDVNHRSSRVQEKCGFKHYRKLNFSNSFTDCEPGYLNLLVNPKKDIKFNFSHPETLIVDGVVVFRPYKKEYYDMVIDFLIRLNEENPQHINWNWARFEWMIGHPNFNPELESSIGLWLDGGKIIGMAIYDMYFGEAFCGVLKDYQYLYPEILKYAYDNLKDENGLAISICDDNQFEIDEVLKQSFTPIEQDETILKLEIEDKREVELPEGVHIEELNLNEPELEMAWLFWRGFDHGEDRVEFNQSEQTPNRPRPNFNLHLSLVAVNEKGEYVGYCGMWYDKRTDYAYLEPLCVVPSYRKMGIAKALVNENLNRVKDLGAKSSIVISDQEFYKRMGFKKALHFTFYKKHKTRKKPVKRG